MARVPALADYVDLLAAAREVTVAKTIDPARLEHIAAAAIPKGLEATWPLHSFLLAEVRRARGESAQARALFREIVDWAASDPYRDGWGASGIAAAALWRLLETNAGGVSGVSDDGLLLDVAAKYWKRRGRLGDRMFDLPPILGALPQLREATLRRLIALAWSSGRRSLAHEFLGEYLKISRDGVLAPVEQAVFEDAVAQRALSRGRSFLMLGKHLLALGKTEPARHALLDALRADEPDVVAEARLDLLGLMRDKRGNPCVTSELDQAVDSILSSKPPAAIAQRALLVRAKRYLHRSCTADVSGFEADLNRLLAGFPRSHSTVEALLTLADFHLDRYFDSGDKAQLARSLARFAAARELNSDSAGGAEADAATAPLAAQQLRDLAALAWFKPAIALYARATDDSRRAAVKLLEDLLDRPYSRFHLAARFWLGRIEGELRRPDAAVAHFERVIGDQPYDYYAIRARMHRQLGDAARGVVFPDAKTSAGLQAAMREGSRYAVPRLSSSPYHERLDTALRSGLYRSALASFFTLRRDAFPERALEAVSLDQLDASRRFADVVVLLALRQDAMVAAEKPATAANRLQIARSLANWSAPDWVRGDWPFAVFLAGGRGLPEEARRELQADPSYLAAAYPAAYKDLIEQAARESQLPAEFLYAVARTETAFNPAAESAQSALGLFQFIPSTFRMLNARWRMVDTQQSGAAERFLLTPESNIRLGARWLRDELLARQDGNLVWALMAHNAGPGSVARWKRIWMRFHREDDYEFMVETARFEETRGFSRRALTAVWIAGAVWSEL